jgi:cell division protein FtsW
MAKIAVILFIPVLLCQMGKEIKHFSNIVKILLWGGFSSACVLILTDNLSTAIIVMGITCVMIFIVHPKTRPFIALAVVGLVAIIVSVRILAGMISTSDNFRLRRVIVWLNPEDHASEGGYQIMQALYAIGSGGFFGKGLGNSAQKMVIPEVQNDMILSVICEELGVFGAIIVLVLFGLLLFRLMFIAQNAPDVYSSLVVTGIFAHIALQVFLNVSVVINLIPTTGITLPFISYGGTSILFLMAEMGIALGISRTIKIE